MTPLLEVKELTKRYGAFPAVERISLSILPHRIIGFLGPNGAGKTTTLKMIAGIMRPTSGEILINGTVQVWGDSRRALSIGYLPEQPSFYPWMTGSEVLHFYAGLSGLSGELRKARSATLLDQVGLTAAKNRRVGGYSNGMRQRLGIAQALLHNPELLLLDEPVSALDPIGRHDVLNLLNDIKKERTVLISTHVLSDIDKVGDDVVIIRQGHIVRASSLLELKARSTSAHIVVVFEHAISEEYLTRLKTSPLFSQLVVKGNQLTAVLEKNQKEKVNAGLELISHATVPIISLMVQEPTLEDIFMNLVA